MTCKLIWVTPKAEEIIVYCARVSNPEGQEAGANSERLLRYLLQHKHWSPFEMASACVEIETTRDIARQILRHRMSFQEFSQRYQTSEALPRAPFRRARETDRRHLSRPAHSPGSGRKRKAIDRFTSDQAPGGYRRLHVRGRARRTRKRREHRHRDRQALLPCVDARFPLHAEGKRSFVHGRPKTRADPGFDIDR